jgi:hypothetical protein
MLYIRILPWMVRNWGKNLSKPCGASYLSFNTLEGMAEDKEWSIFPWKECAVNLSITFEGPTHFSLSSEVSVDRKQCSKHT